MSRRGLVDSVMKRTFALRYTAWRAEVGREAIQNYAGSCGDLDCTKVCSRKNIGAFALLFYHKGRYDSRCWGQAPRMETHEFGTVFLFVFDQ